GSSTLTGLLKGNGTGGVLTAIAGVDYLTSAITAIGPANQTADGPTVTFATSSTAFNGLTASTTITGSGDTLTFTNTLAGTLGVGGGGTGLSSVSDGQLLFGSGSTALATLATTTGAGRFLTLDYSTGRPSWAATSSLGFLSEAFRDWQVVNGALAPTTTRGILVSASSTIGGGTQTTGLTISGGATTTGNAYFAGQVDIADGFLVRWGDASTAIWGDSASDYLRFFVNGAERLTLDNGGNVGVASTSPFALSSIHANNGSTRTTLFAIGSSTQNSTTTLFSISNSGTTTIANGVNITDGCFAMDNVCISASEGLTQIGPVGAFQTGPGITLATSSTAFNGLTASTTITATLNTITFTNTLAGLLEDAGVANNLTIDAGTINSTPIGNLTPSTAVFTDATTTNLSVSGLASTTNLTVSTTASTTALVISGLSGATSRCLQVNPSGSISASASACGTGSGESQWTYFNGSGVRLATTTNQVLIGGVATATSSLAQLEVLANSTFAAYFRGGVSVGSSSPMALLALHARATDANQFLFTIASSTANSTTTLFSILNTGNVGIGTSTPYQKLSLVGGNLLHIASGNPTLASSTPTSANTYATYVSGHFLYVADGSRGLRIYDVSSPNAPKFVGSYSSISAANGVVVSGRFAYVVGDSSTGLVIIDVSSPSSPTLIGRMNINNAYDLAVSGKYVYVSEYGAGTTDGFLRIVDASDPTKPVLAGSYATGGAPYAIAAGGKYVYVGDYTTNSVQIFDVSNPKSPALIKSYTQGSIVTPTDITLSGAYMYVADQQGGFSIHSIANPVAPSFVGSYTGSLAYYGVVVAGRYAYLAEFAAGELQVLDIGNPGSPSLVGTYVSGSPAFGLSVAGKYAYLASGAGGFHIVDLNGAEFPSANIGSLESNIINIADALNVGGDIYAGGGLNVGLSGIFSRGPIAASVASTTALYPTVANFMGGNVGVGTTSPYARLAIQAEHGYATTTTLFLVSSSTSAFATSTLFKIDNVGNVTILGTASTTNLTISGLGNSGTQPLVANNQGVVSASSTLAVNVGGTGATSFTAGVPVIGGTAGQSLISSSTLSVAVGGTGSSTLSGLLKGNGTGGVLTAIAGTDYLTTASAITSVSAGGITTTGGAVTLATSSAISFNGLSLGQTIVNTTGTFTFTPTLTGTLTVAGGGTGLSTVADGQLLSGSGSTALTALATTSGAGRFLSLDYATGRPSWVSTSTLNLSFSNILGTLGVSQGGTGATTFGQGWVYSDGGTGALAASTSPTVAWLTATSTTATSTFAGGLEVGRGISVGNYLYGANLSECADSGDKLTWNGGTFDCGLDVSSGGGSGTWATTTSQVAGQLINYAANATDIVAIGSSATTTAEYWFDPNTTIAYLQGKVGIASTSPFAPLSIHANNGSSLTTLFAIGSSTASATSTLFSINNAGLISGIDLSLSGGATSTNFLSTGSTTIAGTFNATNGGNLSGTWGGTPVFQNLVTVGNLLASGSSTLQNFTGLFATTSQATTTSFAISSITSGSLIKTTTGGALIGATAGVDYATVAQTTDFHDWNIIGGANGYLTPTSTIQSIIAAASSTIGAGGQATGLTISGGATTTGALTFYRQQYPADNILAYIASSTYSQPFLYASTSIHSLGIGANTLSNLNLGVSPALFGNNNLAFGDEAGISIGIGWNNVAIGIQALTGYTTSPSYSPNNNVAIGNQALYRITTGGSNVCIGRTACLSLTTGSDNFALGTQTYLNNSTGIQNSALGSQALNGLSSGKSYNIGIGYKAGDSTDSSGNILIGQQVNAGALTTDNQLNIGNIIYGTGIGSSTVLGTGTIGIGTTSPFARLSVHANNGSTNTTLFAIGSSTASATTTLFSVNNVGLASTTGLVVSNAGGAAGCATFSASGLISNTGSSCGTSSGASPFTWETNYGVIAAATTSALWAKSGIFASSTSHFTNLDYTGTLGFATSSITASSTIFTFNGRSFIVASTSISLGGGNFTGGNTGVGLDALSNITSGNTNTALGYQALISATSSIGNTAVGYGALIGNSNGVSGSFNTAIGIDALGGASRGSHNIGIGDSAVNTVTGNANIGIGYCTLGCGSTVSGSYNVGIGDAVMPGTVGGWNNIGIGRAFGNNTSGSSNIGIGYKAFGSSVLGEGNIAIGDDIFPATLFGSDNRSTVVGFRAGGNLVRGEANVLLGAYAGGNLNTNAANLYASNNIGIGYNTLFASSTGSNQLSIGNLIFGTLSATTSTSTAFTEATTGTIGVASSSPWAKLSVHANNGSTNTILFAIGSSTASATTTLFSIDNTGLASSTNLVVSGLGSSATSCVQANAFGQLSSTGSSCGTSDGASPFTWETNYGVIAAATTSALWAQSGIFASSTSHFTAIDFTGATSTGTFFVTASSTVGGTFNSTFANLLASTTLYGSTLLTNATSTSLTVMGSTTIGGIFNATNGGNLSGTFGGTPTFQNLVTAGNLLATGSSTLQNFTGLNATTSQATTTSFAISSIGSGSLIKTTTGGALIGATAGVDYATVAQTTDFHDWNIIGGANGYLTPTSTIQSIIAAASSTIGAGGQATGLTISGGATTTLNAYFASNVGIGTSSPYARLSVVGPVVAEYFHATSTTATSTFAGGFNVGGGALVYDYSGGLTTIQNLAIGTQNFEADSGIISWIDMAVTSAAATGTVESYTAQIDGTAVLTVYSISDGMGGIWQPSVGIGSSTPWGTLSIEQQATNTPVFVVGDQGTSSPHLIVSPRGFVGLGTTSPYRQLSVGNNAVFGGDILAAYFTATSSTASVFPYASTTALTVSTTASTTNLIISSTGSSGTTCVQANAAGQLSSTGSSCGTSDGAAPFTWETNYGSLAAATTSALWAQSGIFASSTSHFTNLDYTGTLGFATSSVTASSTIFTFNGRSFIVASTTSTATNGANTGLGLDVLSNITSGYRNTALGYQALQLNTSGRYNTALGFQALKYATSSTQNVAIGNTLTEDPGAAGMGSKNIAIGYASIGATTGTENISIGICSFGCAGNVPSGSYNIGLGQFAADYTTLGSHNIGIGHRGDTSRDNATGGGTFGSGISGFGNVAIGDDAFSGGDGTTGSIGDYNVALGYGAGLYTGTGSGQNVYLGAFAGGNINGGSPFETVGSNNIAIGFNALLPATTSSNTLNIGNFLFGTLPATTTVTLGGTSAKLPTTGSIGIASTTPWATLSVHANNGSTNTTLFAIGSSTASATTTLFSVNNVGLASSTNLVVSGLGSSATSCVQANASGQLSSTGSSCGTSDGIAPFTWETNYGVIAAATTSALWAKNGIFASSTSHFTNLDYTGTLGFATSSTNASSTIFTFNGRSFIVASTSNGTVGGNTGLGIDVLSSITSGDHNTALGLSAGKILTTGSDNTFLGSLSGESVTTGSRNTGVGVATINGSCGTGDDNVAVGYGAMVCGGGSKNVVIGSGEIINGASVNDSVIVGYSALGSVWSPSKNSVIIGTQAAYSAANGNFETIIGYQAGFNLDGGGATQYGNLLIGASSTNNLISGSNNIIIGNNTFATSSTATSLLNIGGILFGNLPATSTAFKEATAGTIGIASSSPWGALSVHANNGSTNTTLFAIGSSTASATTTLFSVSNTGLASTTYLYGAGLSSCTSNNVLTWSAGTFGCEADDNSGGAFAFDPTTNFGVNVNSTTTPIWFVGGLQASSTIYAENISIDQYSVYMIGPETVLSATSTTFNTFVGIGAGASIVSTSTAATSGTGNTVLGQDALGNATSTDNNTAVGYLALAGSATDFSGNQNTALGVQALFSNSRGANNVALGTFSLLANTEGSSNMAIGTQALGANTTGGSNVAIGTFALLNSTSTSQLTAIGVGALQNQADTNGGAVANTAVGYNALNANTYGYRNTAIGYGTLAANITGTSNAALGVSALAANLSGANNVALGTFSLLANTEGSSNMAIGTQALGANTTGGSNVAIGTFALLTATSSSNHVAIGTQALQSMIAGPNNDTEGNVAIGYQAGTAVTYGGGNTFLGHLAGDAVTTGSQNIVIGYDIDAPSATLSNQLSIGNLIFGTGLDGTGTTISSGNIGIGSSTPFYRLSVAGQGGSSGVGIGSVGFGTGYAGIILNQSGTPAADFNFLSGDVATDRNLYINRPTSFDIKFRENGATDQLTIKGTTGNVGVASTSPWANLSVHANNGSTNTTLFAIGSSTASATTTLFTVTNAGNVGIGTDSPTYGLDVTGTGHITGAVTFDSTLSSGAHTLQSGGAGTASFSVNPSGVVTMNSSDTIAGSFGFTFGGGDAVMKVQANGNVGLGTTTPASKLDVNGVVRIEESNESGCFKFDSSTNELKYSNDCTTYNSFTAAAAGGWTDDGPVVRLTTIGDFVGIGTTSPAEPLTIQTTLGGSGMMSLSTAALGLTSGGALKLTTNAQATAADQRIGALFFGVYDGGSNNANAAAVTGWSSEVWSGSARGSYLRFETTATGGTTRSEKMRIDPSGNVGLGTTTPYSKLSVWAAGSGT
ncbi:hypothetical protein A2943_00935, partial [Candidatus Adlerbacteria bacterium RIFCSPLOWO2_01_FULL_51_16]